MGGAEPNDSAQGATSSHPAVGPDGTYRICGLPGGIDGNVQAEYNGRKTAEVHVVMDEANPLGFQSLRIGTTVVEVPAADTTKRAAGAVASPPATPRNG